MEIVQQELDDQVAAIKEAQAAGNTWTAYQLCNQLSVRFAGFDLPKDMATLKKGGKKRCQEPFLGFLGRPRGRSVVVRSS